MMHANRSVGNGGVMGTGQLRKPVYVF